MIERSKPESSPAWLFIMVAALIYGAAIVYNYQPFTFLNADPGWSIEVSRSVILDGDFDLRNQLDYVPQNAGDQTARGRNGQWYSVHEYLMPCLAVPFVVIFGLNGGLILNFLFALILAAGCFHAAAHFAGPRIAFAAACATAFAPVVVLYSYSFSNDLCGAMLLVWAFNFLIERRGAAAGVFFGAAVLGRTVNFFAFPAVILFFLIEIGSMKNDKTPQALSLVFRFAAGALPFALIFLAGNWVMFGSPLNTAYNNWQVLGGAGDFTVVNQFSYFKRPLAEGVFINLFDLRFGLFAGAPLLLPAVIFGLPELFRKDRAAASLWTAAAAALIAAVSLFDGSPGTLGNRYLLGLSAIGTPLLALALARYFPRFAAEAVSA